MEPDKLQEILFHVLGTEEYQKGCEGKPIKCDSVLNEIGIVSTGPKNGLWLDKETSIMRLSGPSSFRLLRKGSQYLLLLGDIHRKINGYCETCECTSKEDCCHYSFDVDFLRGLDKLSRPSNPVDIYVEGYDKENLDYNDWLEMKTRYIEKDKQINQQLAMFKYKYRTCFNKGLTRNKSKLNISDCPTRNINWFYSDPRIYIETRNENLLETKFEYSFFTTILFLSGIPGSRIIDYDMKPHVELLYLLFTDTSTFITKYLQNEKSILYPLILSNHISLIKEYIQYILTNVPKREETTIYLKSCLTLPNIHYRTPRLDLLNSLVYATSFLTEWFVYLSSTRVERPPWLSVSVMGETHCRHFSHFLTKISKEYTLLYHIDGGVQIEGDTIITTDGKSNCLHFSNISIQLHHLLSVSEFQEYYNDFVNEQTSISMIRKILLTTFYDECIKYMSFSKRMFENYIQKDKYLLPYGYKYENLYKICKIDDWILEFEFINKVIKDLTVVYHWDTLETIKTKYKHVLSTTSFLILYKYNIVLYECFDLDYMNSELYRNYDKTITYFNKQTPYNLDTIRILLNHIITNYDKQNNFHINHISILLHYLESTSKIIDSDMIIEACKHNKELFKGLINIQKYKYLEPIITNQIAYDTYINTIT